MDQVKLWRSRWKTLGALPDPSKMSPSEIRSEINELLFDERVRGIYGANDPELLTIIILEDKAHFFDFLVAGTRWEVRGRWHQYRETNQLIQVQFMDNGDEAIGNRLMHLLYEYNVKVVGEELLYVRTTPIEEGTLEYSAFRGVAEKKRRAVKKKAAATKKKLREHREALRGRRYFDFSK